SLSQNSHGGTRSPQRVQNADSPPDFRALGDCFAIVLRTRSSSELTENFSFHLRFRCIQDGPGGVYKSGWSSGPAQLRSGSAHHSIGVGGSLSGLRTGCFGKNSPSSFRPRGCAQERAARGQASDLGGQSTSLKTVSLRRRSQIF